MVENESKLLFKYWYFYAIDKLCILQKRITKKSAGELLASTDREENEDNIR